jgi:hypothetical protein
MSSNNIDLRTNNQAIIQTDTRKTFLWENRWATGTYTNSTGSDVVLREGTLLGRISSTQKLVPLASGASDGSQYPVGILGCDVSVANGDSKTLTFCTYGDVAEEMVVLSGSDTLSTVISGRSIRDRIGADTVGIRLVAATEMTNYDNS